MQIFTDKSGREWIISITIETVKRVKDLCGVELLDADAVDNVDSFMLNPDRFRDVFFYCLISPPSSRQRFNRALSGGDAVFAAAGVFLEELFLFFREMNVVDYYMPTNYK